MRTTETIKVGDRVSSSAGWVGTVLSIRWDTSLPTARVRWDRTGSIGRHQITALDITRTIRYTDGMRTKTAKKGSLMKMTFITDDQFQAGANAIAGSHADWVFAINEATDLDFKDCERIIDSLTSNSSPCWICGSSDNAHLIVFVDDQGIYAHEGCRS